MDGRSTFVTFCILGRAIPMRENTLYGSFAMLTGIKVHCIDILFPEKSPDVESGMLQGADVFPGQRRCVLSVMAFIRSLFFRHHTSPIPSFSFNPFLFFLP